MTSAIIPTNAITPSLVFWIKVAALWKATASGWIPLSCSGEAGSWRGSRRRRSLALRRS